MYTRSYSDTVGDIIIPEKYGGTSFVHSGAQERPETREQTHNPWEGREQQTTAREEEVGDSKEASATPTRGIGAMLSGLFKTDLFTLPSIGREELLIIATAVFLLFSKEGDKECAIMLLLLLFLG